MKLYIPPNTEIKDLEHGRWQLFVDVTCNECKKVISLSNALQLHDGPHCPKCGGLCQ